MNGGPHLFYNLPLPSWFYTGTNLYYLVTEAQGCEQSCPRFLCSSARVGVEPVTTRSLVRRSTRSPIASSRCYIKGVKYVLLLRDKTFYPNYFINEAYCNCAVCLVSLACPSGYLKTKSFTVTTNTDL